VIGNRSDVEHVPIDKLQVFYHKYDRPDNAVLTVAGKVDEARLVAMVDDYFGPIPQPAARTLTLTYTVEPVQDGERMTILRRVGDIQLVLAAYHIPDGGNPDIEPLDVLSEMLGEQSSGRLYKALVDNKKATQVFGQVDSLNEAGLVYFGAVLNHTDSLDDARNALLEGLKDKDTVASLAGATLIRGTTKKNRQQIQDQIGRLKAQLNVGASATGEILKEAVLPKTEFEQIRRRRLMRLKFGKSDPQMVASTQIRRALYPFPKGDVRGTLSIEEQIEEVKAAKLEDATAFYKSFYGASHGELAVVGDFNPAKVETAFKEELDRALKDGFTQTEMDADRDGWIQSRTVQRAEDRSPVNLLATHDYDNRTLAWDEDFEKKVMALKPDDVVASMRRNLDPAQISTVKAGDFKKAVSAK
jgi:predicted Zn-dependent peptidase